VRDRPSGEPRRSPDEVRKELERFVEFYAIQKRPEVEGITVGDLMGSDDEDVLTLEEIEAAEAAGREIDPRTGVVADR